jgi:hypothetical protein
MKGEEAIRPRQGGIPLQCHDTSIPEMLGRHDLCVRQQPRNEPSSDELAKKGRSSAAPLQDASKSRR